MNLAKMTRGVLLSVLPQWMRSCWASVVGRKSSVEKNTTHETRPTTDETGYSLVEVMASLTILTIAIIPMVGMFDMGLKSAGTSGDYDKARALANLVLEQAKDLSYEEVRDGSPADFASGDDFAGFEYEVEKRYLKRSPTGSGSEPAAPTQGFVETAGDEGLIKLTVTVQWGENKTYTATGLVADGL